MKTKKVGTSSKNPEVTVLILNWNGKQFLDDCLTSFSNQSHPNYEILFVDNGSTDGSVEFVEEKFPHVRVLSLDKNYGFSKGNNEGFKVARGKYVIIINNDITVLKKNWLQDLVDTYETYERDGFPIGSITSTLYEGPNLHEYHDVAYDHFRTLSVLGHSIKTKPLANSSSEVFFCTGTFLKRSNVDLPYDDDYFIYNEDTYLGWMLRLKGMRNVMTDKYSINHLGMATTKRLKSLPAYMTERNKFLNLLICYEMVTLIKISPILLFSLFVHNVLNIRTILPRLRAYLWILTHPLSILKKRRKMQSLRKVGDDEILKFMSSRFFSELYLKQTTFFDKVKSFVVKSVNKVLYYYCSFFGIRTLEHYSKQ